MIYGSGLRGHYHHYLKTLTGGHLRLRDDEVQAREAMAMIMALNRMIPLAMPASIWIL